MQVGQESYLLEKGWQQKTKDVTTTVMKKTLPVKARSGQPGKDPVTWLVGGGVCSDKAFSRTKALSCSALD